MYRFRVTIEKRLYGGHAMNATTAINEALIIDAEENDHWGALVVSCVRIPGLRGDEPMKRIR